MTYTQQPDSFVLPPCMYTSTKPYAGFTTLLHRFGRYERIRNSIAELNEAENDLSDDQYNGSARSLERNKVIDTVGKQMLKPGLAELQDQRVALTPKQEIKLELARLKAGVDKLKENVSPQVPPMNQIHQQQQVNTQNPLRNPYPAPKSPRQPPPPVTTHSNTPIAPVSLPTNAPARPMPYSQPKPPSQPQNPNSVPPAEKQKFMFVGQLIHKLDQRSKKDKDKEKRGGFLGIPRGTSDDGVHRERNKENDGFGEIEKVLDQMGRNRVKLENQRGIGRVLV